MAASILLATARAPTRPPAWSLRDVGWAYGPDQPPPRSQQSHRPTYEAQAPDSRQKTASLRSRQALLRRAAWVASFGVARATRSIEFKASALAASESERGPHSLTDESPVDDEHGTAAPRYSGSKGALHRTAHIVYGWAQGRPTMRPSPKAW
jgi:hypothetical protein